VGAYRQPGEAGDEIGSGGTQQDLLPTKTLKKRLGKQNSLLGPLRVQALDLHVELGEGGAERGTPGGKHRAAYRVRASSGIGGRIGGWNASFLLAVVAVGL
jgi:hypothetical protein